MIGYAKSQQTDRATKKKSQVEKNQDANAELDRIYKEKGIDYCEAGVVKECLKKEVYSFGELLKLTYAHRHKRVWYKEPARRKLLYAYNETIRACMPCHMAMEVDSDLTHALFTRLRDSLLDEAHNMKHTNKQ